MTTYDDTASFFDDTARLYDEWFLKDVHYMDLLASIVRRLRRYKPARILELGCGTGNLTLLLGKHFPDAAVTGVDISQELLSQAAHKCSAFSNVNLMSTDMLDAVASMPPDTSVVANYSLHHLVDTDKRRLGAELGRGLAAGSAVLVGDIFYPPPPQRER